MEQMNIMVDTSKMHFGYNLKRICEKNKITIKEISEGTNIPLNTLYSITKRKTREPRDQEIKEKVFEFLKEKIPDLTWKDFYPVFDPETHDEVDESVLNNYIGILNSLSTGSSNALPSFVMHLFNSLNERGQAVILKRLLDMNEQDQYKKED